MPKTSKNSEALNELEADFYYALADRARTLRGRRPDLTLSICGALMGVTESMASLKFKGSKWSSFEVRVMADEFGVSPAVLYGDEPMPEPTRPAMVTAIDVSRNVEPETTDYGYEGLLAPVTELHPRRAEPVEHDTIAPVTRIGA